MNPTTASTAVHPESNAGQTMVLQHLGQIRAIARRLASRLPPSVEVEELVNIGVLGLLDAADRFDSSKGVPFRAYAEMRIRGQMIDALRADDLVPRSVRRKHNRLEQERNALSNRLGRVPTRDELRDQLDMDDDTFDAFVSDARVATIASLDAPVGEDGSTTLVETLCNELGTSEDCFADKEMRLAVATAVRNLPERERVVVTSYYLHRLTLQEIGQRLGVTESRACQLRGQGVKRLQYRLRNLRG